MFIEFCGPLNKQWRPSYIIILCRINGIMTREPLFRVLGGDYYLLIVCNRRHLG